MSVWLNISINRYREYVPLEKEEPQFELHKQILIQAYN